MYWFSETNRNTATDWRPEIHDSDGLAIWTGAGERLWRPLNNPETLTVSFFSDTDPKGFGLLQRDRAFSSYGTTPSLLRQATVPMGRAAAGLGQGRRSVG